MKHNLLQSKHDHICNLFEKGKIDLVIFLCLCDLYEKKAFLFNIYLN